MLLCFLVAATVWLLNALNKTYENVRISYPVAFVYNKKKLVPVLPPPKEVIIVVTGKGWKLLRRSLDIRIRPARIKIKNLSQTSFLTGRSLRPALNAALDGLKLNYVVTDTIHFNFEPVINRTLKLSLNSADVRTAPGFVVSGNPEIVPKAISVSGPVSVIKALPDPFPLHLPDSNLSKDYSAQIPVSFLDNELIKPNVQDIMVTFGVKALKQEQVKVPIILPPNLAKTRFKMNPDSALIQFWRHPDSLNEIAAAGFKVQAVLDQGKIIDTIATLNLTQFPKGLKQVSVSPKRAAILQR